MGSRQVTLPEQRNYGRAYELAYELACEQLARIDDIEEQCRRSDAQYQVIGSEKAIIIQYLNQSYLVTLPDAEVSLLGSEVVVPIREKLIMLHYFTAAKGVPLAHSQITFRELPEGIVYSPTFYQRTIKPLLKYFGQEPQNLVVASEKLGGWKTDYGDIGVTINAFSCVPITIILWRGDEEFAPQGSIVFDATISDYLPTEDITVLCETITWRLIKYSRGTQ